MAGPIAGASSGMSGVGALLANGSGAANQGAPGGPPAPAGASMPGMGGDMVRDQLQQAAMSIRPIADAISQLEQQYPMLSADVQQIQQLLKGMIVKLAQVASQQTASGMAVPTAGM